MASTGTLDRSTILSGNWKYGSSQFLYFIRILLQNFVFCHFVARPGKQGGHTNHNKLLSGNLGQQATNIMHTVINHGKNKVETNDLF